VLDLVTASPTDDLVSVLLGQGDGSFGAATQFAVGDFPVSVTSADFNGDGVLDLVTADYNDDTVSVLLGTGDGSFGAATQFSVGDFPVSVTSADFNGDGVLDLVTADFLDNAASVLLAETTLSGETAGGIEALNTFSLTSIADSRQGLTAFRQTLADLSSTRGELGAFQSRVSVAISNLEVGTENFKAAESRIRDADVAEESSRLVRLNILQQTASSVLAQANQQPALALQLLSGR
jgi:flagellin-like hook-associated protein FlgL